MKKAIAFLCCLTLILTVFSAVPVSAVGFERAELAEFPAVLSQKQIQESRLTRKLPEYDSYKNAVGYETADGTKTVFIFGEEIKYVDETGVLRDKDINVVPTDLFKRLAGYAYEVKSSDVKTYFPEKLTQKKGIKLVYQGHSIEMCPSVCPEEPAAARKAEKDAASDETVLDNVIQYDRAMDADTHIRLKTTYSGIKEDIILDRYTGTNRFSFIVDFGDLTPVEQNRGIAIYDGETVLMKMPAAFVEDAENRFTVDNTIEVRPRADGKYDVTIVVDETFLTDPDTAYPVIVDPGTLVQYYHHMDASVSSLFPYDCFGSLDCNYVGKDASNGIWQFYVGFDLSPLDNLQYDDIISAYYRCYDTSSRADNSIVSVYLPFEEWTETSIRWNNKPSCMSEKLCAVNVNASDLSSSGTNYYDFYITAAVMAWLQGLPNYGLCFKERIDSGWRAFVSKNGDMNLPCLIVKYEYEPEVTQGVGIKDGDEYYIKCKRSNKYLTHGSIGNEANIYQSNYTGESNQKWKLIHKENGYYEILPASSATYCIDLYCGATQPSGNTNDANIQLYQRKTSNADNQRWKIIRNWNGTYRFLSKYCNDTKAMVVQQASYANNANVFLYTYSPSYVYNDDWTLEPLQLYGADFYSFTEHGDYGINTRTCMGQATELSNSIGFTANELCNYDALSAYVRMQTASMWYFSGHGYRSGLWFHTYTNNWENSYISAMYQHDNDPTYFVDSISSNGLSNLKLAVFSCCQTGENDYDSNMVGSTFKRGAHYVIGHTQITFVGPDYQWMVLFLAAIDDYKSIYDAMEEADNAMYNNPSYGPNSRIGNLNQRHTLGDGSIVLKHSSQG